ncbi:serine/threonine-protein phosphatase [Nocardia sp. BMG111209]|uniref:serine/threonine-protein phosphatase n=1 Tax=Nocardia sp. BMG111209 TaxID=1160137 RepID=UPI00037DE991|nr:serine/threonine-protein phosphatase [Nocardia sp. BMG111209]
MSAPNRCPACGAEIAGPADRFCENCGRDLNPAPDEPATTLPIPTGEPGIPHTTLPATAADASAPCAGCGGTGFDADGYCAGCGELRSPPDGSSADLGAVLLSTHRGKVHAHNEDAVSATVVDDGSGPVAVIVLCDGVSTSSDPQAASGAAVRAGGEGIVAALAGGRDPVAASRFGLDAAFEAVRATAGRDRNAPSCTYVSAIVRRDPAAASGDPQYEITVANVGDSRGYWLAAGSESRRLTVDDSWAQVVIAAGQLDEATAMRDPRAHALVRWLGADSTDSAATTDIRTHRVGGPGLVLLCSDGLWNYLPGADDLANLVAATAPDAAANALVDFALAGGGSDNITVALVPVPMPGQSRAKSTPWSRTGGEQR